MNTDKLSSEEHKTLVLRERCRLDFYFYCRYIFKEQFGIRFVQAPHHKLLCDALMGVYKGRHANLIANLPRRFGKTEIFVNSFISWCFGMNPACKFILASYSAPLAQLANGRIRDILLLGAYQRIFPNVALEKHARGVRHWRTTAFGETIAVGLKSSPLGIGAGVLGAEGFGGALVIDDPHANMQEFRSLKVKDKAWQSLNEGLLNSINSTKTPVIAGMQRLSPNDVSGRLLALDTMDFHHVEVKGFDEETQQSIWPERVSTEKLLGIKKKNPFVFAAQVQQQPYMEDGDKFKDHYFEEYEDLPARVDGVFVVADTATKAGQEHDYTVVQCWAYVGNAYNKEVFLVDQVREKLEVPDLEPLIIAFYEKQVARFMGLMRGLHIEDKSSGIGLCQGIRRKGIPVNPLPANRNKVDRANEVLGFIAANKIRLPKGATWLVDFMSEHKHFPKGEHDDQVDATVHAQHVIYGNINIYEGNTWI